MTLREFIREHRAELDLIIRRLVPNIGTLNDTDRAQWINNDESLYRWYLAEKRLNKKAGI